MTKAGSLDHRSIAVLGLLTICSYGAWYYSFGVLLDPILTDTGWSESTLTSAFSSGSILIGVGSILGGRILDRWGTTPLFLIAGIIGGGGFVLASFATNVAVFVAGSVVGMALYGAFGFYHITMTAAARTNPGASARAISALTIWGAVSSAIFLPGSAWLVATVGWRDTIRVMTAVSAFFFLLAAVTVKLTANADLEGRMPLRAVVKSLFAARETRMFTLAVAMGGVAISTLLVYQVPAMTAAGLPLGTAATMAGIRGFAQLGGRLPLAPIVDRLGANVAMQLAFVSIAVGGLLLTVAGTVWVALVFALFAGAGIGAFSPLHGIRASEIFDPRIMGGTLGLLAAAQMLAGAIGPAVAGVLAEQTGDRRFAGLIIAVVGFIGLALIRRSD